jgi:hypothetical protein
MYWTFDRATRIQQLVDRQREAERYLLRSRCDIRDSDARARIDNRLVAIHRRIRVLCDAARKARRTANAV